MGGRREGRGAEEAGRGWAGSKDHPSPGVSEVGCRLKGSSSLVEWCWGIVGDRMGRKRGRTIVNSTVGSKTNLKYIFVDF